MFFCLLFRNVKKSLNCGWNACKATERITFCFYIVNQYSGASADPKCGSSELTGFVFNFDFILIQIWVFGIQLKVKFLVGNALIRSGVLNKFYSHTSSRMYRRHKKRRKRRFYSLRKVVISTFYMPHICLELPLLGFMWLPENLLRLVHVAQASSKINLDNFCAFVTSFLSFSSLAAFLIPFLFFFTQQGKGWTRMLFFSSFYHSILKILLRRCAPLPSSRSLFKLHFSANDSFYEHCAMDLIILVLLECSGECSSASLLSQLNGSLSSFNL